MDTRAYNVAEDAKQLDGAHKHLAEQGVLHRPMLLSTKLSLIADSERERARSAAPRRGGERLVGSERGRDAGILS